MTVSFDRPLYILPFDQRESFQTRMYGWKAILTAGFQAVVPGARRCREWADSFKQTAGG
jgi:hypothetical protein